MERWVPRISRTTDQMVQAARSGKQNIVEGSFASAVSKETEVKLTGVALASLGELLEDYRDFLKDGGLRERMTRARIEFRNEAIFIERRRSSERISIKTEET